MLAVASARAQDEPTIEIDKIVVTASRRQALEPTAADTTTTIAPTLPPSRSAGDLIGARAGIHTLNHGGLEAATSVSVRGSSSAQVAVFLDGVPLETAGGDGVGLGDIDAAGLSSIAVYKSFTPAALGSGTIGGAIELKSRQPARGWHHRYDLSYGSFNTASGSAEVSNGSAKNEFLFRINARHTAGNFTFLDDNGTPLNSGDDARVKRRNNAALVTHPYLNWQHRLDERHAFKVAAHFFRIESGVPGLQSFQSTTASRSLTDFLGSAAFSRAGDQTDVTDTVYWRFIKSQFSDPNGEIGLGAGQDNDDASFIGGNKTDVVVRFSPQATLNLQAEYAFETFDPRNYLSPTTVGQTSSRQQINLAAEQKLTLLEERLKLVGGTKITNAFYNINNNDPSLAGAGTFFSKRTEHPLTGQVAASFALFDGFEVNASGARGVRLPKFSELFGDQGYALGNPALTSEKTLKGDVGITWQRRFPGILNKTRVAVSYFESRVDDLIQFELVSGLARASNLGKASLRGVEVSGSLSFAKRITASLDYTWQNARDRAVNPGNFLVGRPEHEGNAEIAFDRGPWHAAARANVIDNQYLDALNTQKINLRPRLDADVGYLWRKKYRVGIEARNISGSQIVDAVGFPLPGRSFFGRVGATF